MLFFVANGATSFLPHRDFRVECLRVSGSAEVVPLQVRASLCAPIALHVFHKLKQELPVRIAVLVAGLTKVCQGARPP